MTSPTKTILLVGLLVLAAAAAVAPSATAERITGCADGWQPGDRDCFAADYDPYPRCLNVRECDDPPDS